MQEMQETWVRSLGQEDPLEKEMTIHSSILVSEILWTKELGRLQSMGSQGVGHDWEIQQHKIPETFAGAGVWGRGLHAGGLLRGLL